MAKAKKATEKAEEAIDKIEEAVEELEETIEEATKQANRLWAILSPLASKLLLLPRWAQLGLACLVVAGGAYLALQGL